MRCSIGLVIVCLMLCSGCSSLNKKILQSASPVFQSNLDGFLKEPDMAFAKESLPAHIKLLEGLQLYDPNNMQLCELLSRSFFSYAFGFVEGEDSARACQFYIRGVNAALSQWGGFSFLMAQPVDILKQVFLKSSPKDRQGWFWAVLNFSAFAEFNKSNPDVLAKLPFVQFLAQDFIQENPSFYHGGAHLILATSYASVPKMLGGKMELSKEHFEKALHISHRKFLPIQYYYLKYYCINAQDLLLAKSLIEEILAFDVNSFEQERLANTIVRERVKLFSAELDTYFLTDDSDDLMNEVGN